MYTADPEAIGVGFFAFWRSPTAGACAIAVCEFKGGVDGVNHLLIAVFGRH
ncbi:hypothetical protein [Nostoc sp. C110]|uniref:hypothetical protein n=1 Tax=Nostoc sp. C110 TaxID=3349876 RepID=UPI00370D01BC